MVESTKTKQVNGVATRTLVQALLGFIVSGGLTQVWEVIVTNHSIDPTVTALMAILLTYVVAFAMNNYEAKGNDIPVLTGLKANKGVADDRH